MNFINVFIKYNIFFNVILSLKIFIFYKNFKKINFLYNYYFLNDLIWQEGFFIDFIQKKLTDNWIKKFFIYSSYLFNERLIFDKLIKFFLILIIYPISNFFLFENNNISNLLLIICFLFFIFYYVYVYIYLFMLMF